MDAIPKAVTDFVRIIRCGSVRFLLGFVLFWTCAITATAGDTVSDSLTCAAEAVTVPIRQQRNRIAMIDFFIEFPLKY